MYIFISLIVRIVDAAKHVGSIENSIQEWGPDGKEERLTAAIADLNNAVNDLVRYVTQNTSFPIQK